MIDCKAPPFLIMGGGPKAKILNAGRHSNSICWVLVVVVVVVVVFWLYSRHRLTGSRSKSIGFFFNMFFTLVHF